MPWSSDDGKRYAVQELQQLRPESVLDVGAGAGVYGRLIRFEVPSVLVLDAVEIWEPYIERFELRDIYDSIFVADIADFTLERQYDMVILGDVLEHLERDIAVDVVTKLRAASKYILLSLPIVEWHQGEEEGNPHEAHLHHWSHDEVKSTFKVMRAQTYDQIGVYVLKGDLP